MFHPLRPALTRDHVSAALYCCGPAGLSQLTEHIERRFDVAMDGEALHRHVSALLSEGKAVTHQVPFAGQAVTLYSLRGQK